MTFYENMTEKLKHTNKGELNNEFIKENGNYLLIIDEY